MNGAGSGAGAGATFTVSLPQLDANGPVGLLQTMQRRIWRGEGGEGGFYTHEIGDSKPFGCCYRILADKGERGGMRPQGDLGFTRPIDFNQKERYVRKWLFPNNN